MARFLLINGPNLNLLGKREPEIYGATSLGEIEASLSAQAVRHGHTLDCFQSNAEYELVERVQRASEEDLAGIVINPAALGHSSIALRDALLATGVPFIEIHISNIFARETFRHHTYLSDVASGVIVGFGVRGYELALSAAIENASQ
jgi:3-dehydroquinate dehydratase-2